DRRAAGREHGRPAPHRLEHLEAEPLVAARVDVRRRAAIELDELRVGNAAEVGDARLRRTEPAAGDTYLDVDLRERPERRVRVLARIARTDVQHVWRGLRLRATNPRGEAGVEPRVQRPCLDVERVAGRARPGEDDRLPAERA